MSYRILLVCVCDGNEKLKKTRIDPGKAISHVYITAEKVSEIWKPFTNENI